MAGQRWPATAAVGGGGVRVPGMPFTLSHVAAVLPVVGRKHTVRAVPAAWVIGSMVPDLPWFFTGGRGAAFTHSVPGLVTADLALGLALFTLWRGVLFAPVRDLLPPVVGLRLPTPEPLQRTRWGWACVGIALGAATHLVWDGFTHEGRWGVRQVPWLHTEHAGLLGSQWAQFASGLLGGVVLLVVCVRLLVVAAVGPDDGWVSRAQRRLAAATVVAAGIVGAAYGALSVGDLDVEAVLFRAVTRGGALAAAAAFLVCLAWWLRRPRRLTGERLASSAAAPR